MRGIHSKFSDGFFSRQELSSAGTRKCEHPKLTLAREGTDEAEAKFEAVPSTGMAVAVVSVTIKGINSTKFRWTAPGI